MKPRTQLAALRATLKALGESDGFDAKRNAALIAIAEGMASALDAGSLETNTASMWKEYRAAVTALVDAGGADVDDADVAPLIGLPASLGNPSHAG